MGRDDVGRKFLERKMDASGKIQEDSLGKREFEGCMGEFIEVEGALKGKGVNQK